MSITFDEHEIREVHDSHGRRDEYELRLDRVNIYTLAQLRQEVAEEIERRKKLGES